MDFKKDQKKFKGRESLEEIIIIKNMYVLSYKHLDSLMYYKILEIPESTRIKSMTCNKNVIFNFKSDYFTVLL